MVIWNKTATNTPALHCFIAIFAAKLQVKATSALDFQVFLCGSMGSEVPNRRRRAWIIATFEVKEEQQGPFPQLLGKVSC